jgi:hypothetical protein
MLWDFLKKEKPRKYLREDTPELFLLEYHIDNNGNRIESKRKKYSNYNPSEVEGIIKAGQYNSQINGLTMNYLTDSASHHCHDFAGRYIPKKC